MKVLVVGAGMYVTGAGTPGLGTVLPSLFQSSRELPLTHVLVAAPREEARKDVERCVERCRQTLGGGPEVRFEALGGRAAQELLGAFPADGAVVSVPDHVHGTVASPLLQAGVHCLVVKPLSPTLAEARAMVAAASQGGAYGAVEFHKRFDEGNQWVRLALREGRLGYPVSMLVQYSQRRSIPLNTFSRWVRHTNIFQYLAVHYVDLVHHLTGYTPVRASAVGAHGLLRDQGVATPDSVHATVVWKGPQAAPDLVTQFYIGWTDPEQSSAMSNQRFVLTCTNAIVDADQKHRGLEVLTQGEGNASVNPYFSSFLASPDGRPFFQGYGHESIRRFLEDVVDLRQGRTTPAALEGQRPTLRDALPSVSVVEAVNQSLAQQGNWIACPPST